jgi:hypothetical protein
VKNVIGILVGIALNLYTVSGRMEIFNNIFFETLNKHRQQGQRYTSGIMSN